VTRWPAQPVIHEVDTWVWLTELGPDRTLDNVPAHAWDQVALPGVDAVWLMGVWERSPAGLEIALRNEQLLASFRAALPDVAPADVVGSPYCIRRYVVDARLGGPAGLAAARAELARRGVRLLLHYVPNHVAPDHPWVHERPEVFVRRGPDDLAREPDAFVDVDGQVLARGRDPYFPPWPDVVHLDASSARMRDASVETLRRRVAGAGVHRLAGQPVVPGDHRVVLAGRRPAAPGRCKPVRPAGAGPCAAAVAGPPGPVLAPVAGAAGRVVRAGRGRDDRPGALRLAPVVGAGTSSRSTVRERG